MSTSPVCHFGTEIDMDLRFFALVDKYSLVIDSIWIEKAIFFRFLGGEGCPLNMKTLNGYILKCVEDYKYLGAFISNSEKDFKARKGMAWSACNNLHKIWVSDLPTYIKINFFKTLIEPILLYSCKTWTLSSKQHARLIGAYTKLLMRIKCLSWKRHPTIQQIYGDLPRVSTIVNLVDYNLPGTANVQPKKLLPILSFRGLSPKEGGTKSYPILIF